jgi:hypothetical protein
LNIAEPAPTKPATAATPRQTYFVVVLSLNCVKANEPQVVRFIGTLVADHFHPSAFMPGRRGFQLSRQYVTAHS